MGKAHKEFKDAVVVCENCGKKFHPRFSSKGRFCCVECSAEYKHKQQYKLVIEGHPSIMRTNYYLKHFRNDIMREQDYKCAICGCPPEHNGKPLVFIIDHIDGHAANNKRDNLRCICPNCDSQLDTYKSKNKNSDREYYRIHRRK